MLQILEIEAQEDLRKIYLSDRLYSTLFPGLAALERAYGELSATMVWREALAVINKLAGLENLGLEIIQVYNDLLKNYKTFLLPDGTCLNRTDAQADYTAVCVLTCVNYKLVARPDNLSTEDCDDAIREILDIIIEHPVHTYLYVAQRKREIKLDKKKLYIPQEDCLDKNRMLQEPPARYGRLRDSELDTLFSNLFRNVRFENLVGFVKYCESNMTFNSKIERVAYLVFAAQKGWLKSARTLNIQGWTRFMNSILDYSSKLTQSEVLRKYTAVRHEPFFDSFYKLTETLEFSATNLPAKSFTTLKENVRLMHTLYKQYDELIKKEANGSRQEA